MKTKIISLLAVTITAALISQPMLADTTYVYTGNPFTTATAPYSTNDFVTVRVTLASPLGANMPITGETPLAFSISDGVQTITDQTPDNLGGFAFATGPTGMITEWDIEVFVHPAPGDPEQSFIQSLRFEFEGGSWPSIQAPLRAGQPAASSATIRAPGRPHPRPTLGPP